MSRLTPSRLMFALLAAAVAVLLQAPDAFAQATDISTANFSCSGGIASGQLFVSGAGCPTSLTMDDVFSFLVCNFEQLSSNVMGAMYCGMVQNLAPSVMVAVALATSLYGVMFTFGMIPATGQEALKFLLKCAFVIAFATKADYLIGIAYRGALGAISAGSTIAISLMARDGVTTGANVYAQLDGFLSTLFHYATDYLTNPTTGPAATATASMCKNALFAVIGTMFVVFPMLGYMGLMLVARILMTFFRSVFAYIYAIVGITFILLLAPFFVVFSLFKLTSNLFDRWLGYLVSFTLQVVLLFSFLAFIFSMHLERQSVVTNLTAAIMYNSEQAESSSFRLPFSYCTLCDFEVQDKITHAVITEKDPNYIANGQMVCKDHSADSPVPAGLQRITIPDPASTTTPPATRTVSAIPMRPTFATSPDSKGQISSLISFAGNGILSLIILALVIEHMLKLIPTIAQTLASSMSATYATQLGGGGPNAQGDYRSDAGAPEMQMPGESIVQNFGSGFSGGFGSQRNAISGAAAGLKGGADNVTKSLGGALGDFLSDPTKPR